MKQKSLLVFGIFALLASTYLLLSPSTAAAATITVNSKADDTSNDGECTLREAIGSANSDTVSGAAVGECAAGSGNDTINFAIIGTADFTVSGQNGYTIQPGSALPALTTTITINGYSQSGAQANSAVAPAALNGILLIEIDGASTTSVNGFEIDGNSIQIRGLVINNFDNDAIDIDGNNNQIAGCYIGTEPNGTTGAPNDLGISNGSTGSNNLMIGGLNPADRNLLSGNTEGASSPNTNHTNWTYYGNYIGVDKTGMTALPNAQPGGSGAISIDNDDGHRVGGPETGAINVISGNRAKGIAPHATDNLIVQGNYFGVGADGTTAIPNGGPGINISDSDAGLVGGIADGEANLIMNNDGGGISITGSTNMTVHGNTIMNNGSNGVFIFDSSSSQIGGSTSAMRNIISGNAGANISLLGLTQTITDNKIQGNYIGVNANGEIDSNLTDVQAGISILGTVNETLIGGSGSGEGNIIAGNGSSGIVIDQRTAVGFGILTPSKNTILGNRIYGTVDNDSIPTYSTGLGVDLLGSVDNEPDGVPDTFDELGVTDNDTGDSDSGPNNYINFPVINSASQDGTSLSVNFSLDANNADTSNSTYRVEFFANDSADSSGYGEGQTYLGSANVLNGNNQTANITMATSIDLTGKFITATTTAIDTASSSGFGSTSEFSLASDEITVTNSFNLTYTDPQKGTTVRLLLPSGVSNPSISGVDPDSLPQDGTYSYPVGLTSFEFDVTTGATRTVTLYYDLPGDPSDYVARKYNANGQTYGNINGATITREDYNGDSMLKLVYNITDGGELDQDGVANGTIVDPVGLATLASSSLANTGLDTVTLSLIAGAMIACGGLLAYRKLRA